MGSPAAPLYSILTFGLYKNQKIYNSFKNNPIYYEWYIDDVFGIWLDTTGNTWAHFKSKLSQFNTLAWNIDVPTTPTTFLDLELILESNSREGYFTNITSLFIQR
jgi:hypothetical protein